MRARASIHLILNIRGHKHMGDDKMLWILLGLLFTIVLFIARQEDLHDEEEDELLEEEILLYYDEEEEDLLDDDNDRS